MKRQCVVPLAGLLVTALTMLLFGLPLSAAGPVELGGPRALADEGNKLHLPLAVNGLANQTSVAASIGAQMGSVRQDSALRRAQNGGISWARVVIPWSRLEPTEGNFDWTELDARLAAAPGSGISFIAVITGIPEWAGEKEGGYVVRVARDKLPAYQLFIKELARRNLEKGYGVRYWEVFNEVDNQDNSYAPYVSCAYGDHPDLYLELLRNTKEALAQVDATAKVAVGGLAMETLRLADGSYRFNLQFADQIMSAIAGQGSNGVDYFDAMNVHIYAYYYVTKWSTPSTPGLLSKVNYLKQIMRNHGIDRPVLVTEASLALGQPKPDLQQQAAYAVRVFAEGVAAGVPSTIWFALSDNVGVPGEYSGLLDSSYQPKPAYWTTRYLARRLGGATYLGPSAGLQVAAGRAVGFSFSQRGQPFHLLWGEWTDYNHAQGPVGGDATVKLPGRYARVLDMYGQTRQEVAGVDGVIILSLTYQPVYVELYDSPPPTPTPVVWTPTAVTVQPGSSATLQGNGGLVEVDIPANALPTTLPGPVTFRFGPASSGTQARSLDPQPLLPAFRLEAVDAGGTPVTTMAAPLDMRVYYRDEAARGLYEPLARMERRADWQQDWGVSGLHNQRADIYGNEISSSVTELGDFRAVAADGHRLYLPSVVKGSTN